jgi:vacuolar-type H+-ATPase subunit I/STV1
MEFKVSYIKEALKEPLNIGGLLVAGAAAAWSATTGFIIEPTMVLAGALIAEGAYLATVPASSFYRRIVDRRSRHLLDEHRRKQRLDMIKTFDPREREAVEYLSWMKKQIADNYRKFARLQEEPSQVRELEATWEAFVDLLDEYRRRKNHLRMTNRNAVENQLRQAERTLQYADAATRSLHEKNVEILRRRLHTFDDIERSVKRVEAQLQMIENFFGLVNDQVVTMPTPEHILALDFDSLLSSIETTKEILQQTAPIMGQLDSLNREASQLRPSLAGERR